MQPRDYHFWIYILASRSRNLYVGFTNNIHARVEQHRQHTPESHTTKYIIGRLVYFEFYKYVLKA